MYIGVGFQSERDSDAEIPSKETAAMPVMHATG